MSRLPEFSVVIPTYNRLDFLKETLSSVWAQTHSDYETIVVDDGSTDGTMDYVASFGGRVKVLHQPNSGPGAARNLGAKQALGDYVAFLDSDDIWFPWSLATFHELIQHHHEPALLCAATVEFQGKVPEIKQASLAGECFRDYVETASDPNFVGSGTLVVKRSVFNGVGGFDEKIFVGEDQDFFFRVGTTTGFVRALSPITLAHRRHLGNMSTSLQALCSAAFELLIRETEGRYPGGKAREKERWQLLSCVLRPVALSCLRAGLKAEAWHLYRLSFRMNARLRRFRFLAGFLLYGALVRTIGRQSPINSAGPPTP